MTSVHVELITRPDDLLLQRADPGDRVVDRRAFIAVIGGGLLAVPLAAEAQPAGKPPRIGWLSAGSQPDPFLEAFREGLRRLGYVEGQTIAFEIRHAQGSLEALGVGAAELAQSNVAVIVASLTAIRWRQAL